MSTIDDSCSLLQAAIYYASLGWRVFPLAPLTKVPRFKDWPWPEMASNNIEDVCHWWTRWPDSNIGIVADDRLTILDIDRHAGKANGFEVLGDLLDHSTVCEVTPNGGMHFFHESAGCRFRDLPGVNVITGHRYVAAAPSIVQPEQVWENPVAYRWVNAPGTPWDLGITPLSALLLERLRDETSSTPIEDIAIPGLLPDSPAIPYAELKEAHRIFLQTGTVIEFPTRSEVVHSLGTRLYRLGYTDEEVLSLLWSQEQVRLTAAEHRRTEEQALGWLWDGLKKVRHQRTRKAEEVFLPVEGSRQNETFRQLRDACMRLTPADDVKTLLQAIAAARLPAIDEDELVNLIKNQGGRSKAALNRTLAAYKADLGSRTAGPRWKHTLGENQRPVATVENLEILLKHKRTTVSYNLMTHRVDLEVPGMDFGREERLNNQLTTVRSWAAEYGLPMDPIPEQINMLASKNPYHPFQQFVETRAWDGLSRIPQLMATIQTEREDVEIKETLVRRWLLSIIASVYGYGTRAPRGVLTFTGPQLAGKTTWLRYLVPDGMYHQGLLLRADQRDSATKGLRYLIVEIGEIGATFRASDIESLKNYIGQHEDVYRLPYARDESVWQRRTVFAASANEREILRDQTGNTRWWVVPVTGFDLDAMERWWKGGNGYWLQQLWAEVLQLYQQGERWDLSDEELAALEAHQSLSMDISIVEQTLLDTYVWEDPRPYGGYHHPKRMKDIQTDMGWGKNFSQTEIRILRHALQRLTGMAGPTARRVTLATKDGVKMERPQNLVGRWWMLPAVRGYQDA